MAKPNRSLRSYQNIFEKIVKWDENAIRLA